MAVATTFGASKIDRDAPEFAEGVALGKLLAQRGYIVKCGGYDGLMGAVSLGVKEAGGECIGVTLEAFDRMRPQNPNLTRKIVAKSLYERLELLIEGSDLFIAQKGSVGTLNEIFMVAALKYGGLRPDMRIILLGKHYRTLNCFDENFKRVVEFCDSLEELAKRI